MENSQLIKEVDKLYNNIEDILISAKLLGHITIHGFFHISIHLNDDAIYISPLENGMYRIRIDKKPLAKNKDVENIDLLRIELSKLI